MRECSLYSSFLTWLAMLPCPICLLVLALDIGCASRLHGLRLSYPLIAFLVSGVFAWLVTPGSISDLYLCLPCLAIPLCWDSFLYFVLLFLSDGMTLLSPPQCGIVVLLCCSFGLDARDILPLLSLPAIRVGSLDQLGQNPATGKGRCVWLHRALHHSLRLTLVFTWVLGNF